MPRNIEIKARIASVDAMLPRAAELADSGPEVLFQDDTFFRCTHGRLKLRVFADGAGELIFYRRADAAGPKASDYLLVPVPDPDALRLALGQAYGEAGRVRKQRTLFLAGRTRIHLDRVEGLGDFLELEVVLRDDDSLEGGVDEAQHLMRALGVTPGDLVQGAYADLLWGGTDGL